MTDKFTTVDDEFQRDLWKLAEKYRLEALAIGYIQVFVSGGGDILRPESRCVVLHEVTREARAELCRSVGVLVENWCVENRILGPRVHPEQN